MAQLVHDRAAVLATGRFQNRLAAWIDTDRPALDVVALVVDWIRAQCDYPYSGARRYTEFAGNYWWARVPGTYRGGTDVMCGYYLDEDLRQIRCDSLATLDRPNLD